MTKLAYINDQQIITDAAQMLIEKHLNWSGSKEGKPSKDLDHVLGDMLIAHREARFTVEEWREMDELERSEARLEVFPLYEQALELADRKWEAAMTLLGF